MEKTIQLLEELVTLPGIPGREEAVVEYLMNYPVDAENKTIDVSGNVFIEYSGPPKPPIILSAHMDEIGCRVKKIEEDGRLSVIGLEGLDARTLAGQIMQIWSEKSVYDAYVYLNQKTSPSQNYDDLIIDQLRLDLGLMDKVDVVELGIKPNDPVTFGPEFHILQKNMICAKAFDNRCSLAAILRAVEMSGSDRVHRPVLLGTVQEEIGAFGAKAVAFPEKPGAILVMDICGAEVFKLSEAERRTIMGKGPILLNNPGTDRGLFKRLMTLARDNSIPFQEVGYYTRGADPAMLQTKSGGHPMMTIIIPMAYYHAPKGLLDAGDVYQTARLLGAVLHDDEFLDSISPF